MARPQRNFHVPISEETYRKLRSEAERTKRPASHDAFNATSTWRSVVFVPLSTAAAQHRRGPTAVPLAAGAGGLARPSVALCHQVTTLDRAKLTQRLGAPSAPASDAIDTGLKAALDLR